MTVTNYNVIFQYVIHEYSH